MKEITCDDLDMLNCWNEDENALVKGGSEMLIGGVGSGNEPLMMNS
jgi:hypothetical protein